MAQLCLNKACDYLLQARLMLSDMLHCDTSKVAHWVFMLNMNYSGLSLV